MSNDPYRYGCIRASMAYHEYLCCDTCWNGHPLAKQYGSMFAPEFVRYLRDTVRIAKMIDYINGGFTFQQAVALTDK